MRSYLIDFVKITKDLLPHFLQQKGAVSWVTASDFFWVTADGQAWGTGSASRHLAWLRVLVSPLTAVNELFRTFVAGTRYSMYLTGQVVYLEKYLNDLYDPISIRIYIEDGDASVPLYLDNKPDAQPIIVYNKSEAQTAPILLNRADLANDDDFIIVIPYSNITSTGESLIRARVNQYKQAGKRYSIQVTPGGPAWPYN
jgi:hypothetical protein